jgi:hypothetical protein
MLFARDPALAGLSLGKPLSGSRLPPHPCFASRAMVVLDNAHRKRGVVEY